MVTVIQIIGIHEAQTKVSDNRRDDDVYKTSPDSL